MLLRRLEEEPDGAVEPALFDQHRRRTEEHRHVAVMPARVHPADLRRVRETGLLNQRQRVHVSPQPYRPRPRAECQGGHHTCSTDSTMRGQAERTQQVRDVRRRRLFLEPQLGPLVQPVPPLPQPAVQIVDHA